PSLSRISCPILVMIRMLAATYPESVSSTPILQIGESNGPIAKGTTYIVRPRMHPLNMACNLDFISAGSAQLLVGPASSRVLAQINVRASSRATSLGCDRARKQPGRFSSFNFVNVPALTSNSQIAAYSSAEPLHQKTLAGWHNVRISS